VLGMCGPSPGREFHYYSHLAPSTARTRLHPWCGLFVFMLTITAITIFTLLVTLIIWDIRDDIKRQR
jgi:uncharacterized protein YqhQ